MVTKVWTVFATQIFPLVRSVSTPKSLTDAMTVGADAVKQELDRIQALALDWLTSYVRVYGKCVTPYIHVLGRHLHFFYFFINHRRPTSQSANIQGPK